MFVGRQLELKSLLDVVKSDFKEFVPIIGKRGVGKTTLLEKLKSLIIRNDNFIVLDIVGKRSAPNKMQLQKVAEDFSERLNHSFSSKNWNRFFVDFNNYLNQNGNKTIVLLIDEFPWLNVKGSWFVEEFGAFWNHVTTNNIEIIITGSSVAWMNKNVFRNKGGLYHKTTSKISLKPFSYDETMKFLLH